MCMCTCVYRVFVCVRGCMQHMCDMCECVNVCI